MGGEREIGFNYRNRGDRDKEEIWNEIGHWWGMGVDEDLSLTGERRMRRRLVEVVKRERARGRDVVLTNKELCLEGRKWR